MVDARAPSSTRAASWPEADALFRSDPRWLGSDDAYSVSLGGGRTLWLFGDTFVDGASRRDAAFVRNSIGIQRGDDPSRASISFHWGTSHDGSATSFFDAPPGTWFWPLHGARIGTRLILFMMHVRSPAGGDGSIDEWRRFGLFGFFEVFGWAASVVDNPDDAPSEWRVRPVAERTDPIVLGASVLVESEHLIAYGWDERKRLTVARWPLDIPDALGEPEWWTGAAWGSGQPAVVIDRGATEFSIFADEHGGFVHVQMSSAEQALSVARAQRPQGPWSEPRVVFRPPESARDGVFVYAGKAHPHLLGSDLVCTYASNADVDTCLDDPSIYYPRFVRLGAIT